MRWPDITPEAVRERIGGLPINDISEEGVGHIVDAIEAVAQVLDVDRLSGPIRVPNFEDGLEAVETCVRQHMEELSTRALMAAFPHLRLAFAREVSTS